VTTSPYGLVTADKLIENTTSNTHNCNSPFYPTAGMEYTHSCYFKKAERNIATIAYTNSGGGMPTTTVSVNLDTGATTLVTG